MKKHNSPSSSIFLQSTFCFRVPPLLRTTPNAEDSSDPEELGKFSPGLPTVSREDIESSSSEESEHEKRRNRWFGKRIVKLIKSPSTREALEETIYYYKEGERQNRELNPDRRVRERSTENGSSDADPAIAPTDSPGREIGMIFKLPRRNDFLPLLERRTNSRGNGWFRWWNPNRGKVLGKNIEVLLPRQTTTT